MKEDHFGVDESGIIGLATIGLVSETFVLWTLRQAGASVSTTLSTTLGLLGAGNMASLGRIARLLRMIGDPALGES